ncbi:antitoxin Xre/MbcA/ParS toxin-binding domain-containing protein [Celeribacter halophilus]|uniref:type II RES/Xre toxin-antitoxin system antitoxin n=1 Tax=Celeribacter halophilus TaxID=576117 RepID=UPI003A8F0EBF
MLSSGDTLEKAIGISPRTLQHHKKDISKPLSIEQSNRIWRFAKILGRAIDVLGSKEEAEMWMNQPAFGLENRKPIDLLASAPGAEAVQDYLTRVEYGIYM